MTYERGKSKGFLRFLRSAVEVRVFRSVVNVKFFRSTTKVLGFPIDADGEVLGFG